MNSFYRSTGKRLIDIILAGVGTVVLAPVVPSIEERLRLQSLKVVFSSQLSGRQHNALKGFFLCK